jgi:hypothetical protein
MAVDTIWESEEGLSETGSEITIFNTWEHYPPGVYTVPEDSVRANGQPAFLCAAGNPEWGDPAYEFGHANSLAYVDETDSYFINFRWLDANIKVARGAAEPFVWQAGGEHATLPLTVPPPGTELYHAHYSDIWADGMVVFDNRHRDGVSRLVEYAYDDTQYQQVWEWESDSYENILGDVRRIPLDGCENRLVAFSNQGRIAEIDPSGEIVWDAGSAIPGNVVARIYWLPDLYDFSGVAYPP